MIYFNLKKYKIMTRIKIIKKYFLKKVHIMEIYMNGIQSKMIKYNIKFIKIIDMILCII